MLEDILFLNLPHPTNRFKGIGGNAQKEATKNEILKRDLLCTIVELEKGSNSDRHLPDVYGENTSGNSSTTVGFTKEVGGRSR